MSESEIFFLITRYLGALYQIIIGASSAASTRKVGQGLSASDGKIFLFDVNKGKSQKPNESPQLFCTEARYRRLIETARLRVLDVQSPLATGKEATR